jgi:N-acetylmuramoyl-L-alanine amidase
LIKLKRRFLAINITILLVLAVITSAVYASEPYTIIIDPGHGGIDGGCVAGSLLEKDINLDIAGTVKSLLEQKGYKVTLTRDKDISLYKFCNVGDTMPRRDLNERVGRINSSNASLFVSIHVNSFSEDPSISGSNVYFYSMECLKSKKLAQAVQKELNAVTFEGQARTPHNSRPNGYYILRKTVMPGILVETGFLTNTVEKVWFAGKEYRVKLAEAISAGIENYVKSENTK